MSNCRESLGTRLVHGKGGCDSSIGLLICTTKFQHFHVQWPWAKKCFQFSISSYVLCLVLSLSAAPWWQQAFHGICSQWGIRKWAEQWSQWTRNASWRELILHWSVFSMNTTQDVRLPCASRAWDPVVVAYLSVVWWDAHTRPGNYQSRYQTCEHSQTQDVNFLEKDKTFLLYG